MAAPRILIIRGGAIGDFILTLPAIQLLRQSIPGAQVEILGYPAIIELAKAGGLADAIQSLEHGRMARLFAPGSQIEESLMEYFRSFNLVVSYLYDPDGVFRGNMERIGVKTFLEVPHHVEPGQGHAAEQLAKPLEKLALFLEDPAPRLPIAAHEETGGDPAIIAFHPGSGSLKKNWPAERWSAAGRDLMERFPQFRWALITGEAEAERGITSTLLTGWRGQEFLHWDQLSLVELAARLAGCRGFMGHDSGISHLAAACGVRCLLFFGPTDADTWAPRNAGVQVLEEPFGDLANLELVQGRAAMEEFLRGLGSPKLR